MLGNKQQGEKGIIFTANYVKRFNEMEETLRNQAIAKQEQQPTVGLGHKEKELIKGLIKNHGDLYKLIDEYFA